MGVFDPRVPYAGQRGDRILGDSVPHIRSFESSNASHEVIAANASAEPHETPLEAALAQFPEARAVSGVARIWSDAKRMMICWWFA